MSWLRRNFEEAYLIFQVIVDGFAIVLAFLASVALFSSLGPSGSAEILTEITIHSRLGILGMASLFSVLWFLGTYETQKSILNVEEYRKVTASCFLAFLLTAAFLFLFRHLDRSVVNFAPHLAGSWVEHLAAKLSIAGAAQWKRAVYLGYFGFALIAILIERFLMFQAVRFFYSRGFGISTVILGTGPVGRRVEQKMRHFPGLGFRFSGFLEVVQQPAPDDGLLRLGCFEDLPELIETQEVRRVIIAAPEIEEERLLGLCRKIEELGLEYYVVPRLYHFFSHRFLIESLDTVPLLKLAHCANRPHARVLKRCFDLFFGGILLLAAIPLLIAIAWSIKRRSPGPAFFWQQRIGLGGKPFKMLKFRTMHFDLCGDGPTPKDSSDPRLIPTVGSFLRRTSLDELPQLLNIARGDMSLVGPRPEMPFIVDTYSPLERMRLEVKPGLTGLWQVSESRNAPIHENLDYDLYYIENQDLFLDLVILSLTLIAVPQRGTH